MDGCQVGAGAFEEIPISAFMASLLSSANYAALAAKLGLFSPGDVKFSVNGSLGAAGGWLVYDGAATLGNTGATAATFHDVSFYELYKAIYNNISNTYCPVAGGRTSIDADWGANKAITLPLFNGRALLGAGTGVGLTARPAGQSGGVESVTLGLGNMPYHQHAVYIGEPVGGHSHALGDYAASGQAGNDNGATVGIWYNPTWNVTVPISSHRWQGSTSVRLQARVDTYCFCWRLSRRGGAVCKYIAVRGDVGAFENLGLPWEVT